MQNQRPPHSGNNDPGQRRRRQQPARHRGYMRLIESNHVSKLSGRGHGFCGSIRLKPDDSSRYAARICRACCKQTRRNGMPKSHRHAISIATRTGRRVTVAHVLHEQLRPAQFRRLSRIGIEPVLTLRPGLLPCPAPRSPWSLSFPLRATNLSSASAAVSDRFGVRSRRTRITVTSFPLICTGISISSSFASSGSLFGHGARRTALPAQQFHISAERNGATAPATALA